MAKKDQMATHMVKRKGWKIRDGKSYQIGKRLKKDRWQLTWQQEMARKPQMVKVMVLPKGYKTVEGKTDGNTKWLKTKQWKKG